MEPRKILIIQTAFIGDLILTTPLFRALKEGFPEAQISALVIPSTAEILETNPHIDGMIVYDKRGRDKGVRNLLRLARDLRERQFDLAVVPHRSIRSAFLTWRAGIPRRIGFDRSTGGFLFTEVVRYREDVHEIERNLYLTSPLGLKVSMRDPQIFPNDSDWEIASFFLRESGALDSDRIVAIAPGSVWPTKRWIPERFAAVADRLIREHGVRVVLVGGRDDKELCGEIAEMVKNKPLIAARRLTLRQSAALLARCEALLSNDSAPTHMAVAVGTPVVAIFGPTVPAFGFTPYGEGHSIVEEDLDCRPCGVHGGRRCPKGHFRCMLEIDVERVFVEVSKKLTSREEIRYGGRQDVI